MAISFWQRNLMLFTFIAASFIATTSIHSGAETRYESGLLVEGTPAQIRYYIQTSSNPGPTVMIIGGLHGDEPAGAYAAGQIRYWPITRGTLIVVPRANVPALNATTRLTPGEPEELHNLNRNFSKAKGDGAPRGPVATEIWKLVTGHKPQWILDLHEGYDFHQINKDSVGSSIITFPIEENRQMAAKMLEAVNATIEQENKKFIELKMPHDGSLARAASEHMRINSMILEVTSKSQALSKRARQHRIMVHRFLRELEMIDENSTVDHLTDRTDSRHKSGRTRIALYDAGGSSGKGVPRTRKLVTDDPELTVTLVGPEDIRNGALNQFNAVMFTGGSGSAQAKALGDDGRKKVKQFVDEGGGYLGICAGTFARGTTINVPRVMGQ